MYSLNVFLIVESFLGGGGGKMLINGCGMNSARLTGHFKSFWIQAVRYLWWDCDPS
jgi:hypothetical protein